jgi:hypothetical protein
VRVKNLLGKIFTQSFVSNSMWRDDRAISNILEEFIALAVILLAMSLLLVSLHARFTTEVDSLRTMEMKEDARYLLERLASHPKLTKDGEYLLLNEAPLANASIEWLRDILQTDYGFRLTIHDVTNLTDHVFQTSAPAGNALGATTSCNIWVRPGEIHAARISILIWGG